MLYKWLYNGQVGSNNKMKMQASRKQFSVSTANDVGAVELKRMKYVKRTKQRSSLAQSWDEIAKLQRLAAKPSQTEHNISEVAVAPATILPEMVGLIYHHLNHLQLLWLTQWIQTEVSTVSCIVMTHSHHVDAIQLFITNHSEFSNIKKEVSDLL